MTLLKRLADAGLLLADLVTRDPAFVRGGDLPKGHVPVFTFHSLEPRSFERRMRYLCDAGYQTIGLSQYLDFLLGRGEAPGKAVLLTIDDGRATTWTVAYPILKKLRMRATAFLVTSAVHDSDARSKTIAEMDASEWDPLVARDETKDQPFVTWGEVRAMRDVIDIASHTHLHARIAISDRPEGVMTPVMQTGYGEFDCPFVWRNGRLVRGRDVPAGTPLPASAPRMSGRPAYRTVDGRYETEAEVRDAVRFDLAQARRALKERADIEARSVCFPWHEHSPLAQKLAAEVGYVAGFVGKVSGDAPISLPGGDPFLIARIGEDYVERLPGPGRKSLLSVLLNKFRRAGAARSVSSPSA